MIFFTICIPGQYWNNDDQFENQQRFDGECPDGKADDYEKESLKWWFYQVRNKKETIYCYDDEEKKVAMVKIGARAEITRFKGLGEISPDEFSHFIGEDMRIDPVVVGRDANLQEMLDFFMGKNTPDRQRFIIDNLRIEKDEIKEELEEA